MKTTHRTISFLLAACLLFPLLASCQKTTPPPSVTELGIPYEDLPPEARIPWDMVIEGDYLYVGAGDYGRNISPRRALRRSLTGNHWEECGDIADEQINRFVYLGDTLTIPGTDPTGSWETGCYYLLGEEGFYPVETIPHGVHNFDMVLYEGKLFAALGVDTDTYPVVMSEDGGKSFAPLPILREGEEVSREKKGVYNRIYDFFLFEGKLYLLYYNNLYLFRPENGGYFDFTDSWEGCYRLAKETYVPLIAKCAFAGSYFFTTEELYVCREENGRLGKPSLLRPEGKERIHDLFVWKDQLYLLAVTKEDKTYRMTVLVSDDGKNFSEVFSFSYSLPAMSFIRSDDAFYFGMGSINGTDRKNGTVLKVTVPFSFVFIDRSPADGADF